MPSRLKSLTTYHDCTPVESPEPNARGQLRDTSGVVVAEGSPILDEGGDPYGVMTDDGEEWIIEQDSPLLLKRPKRPLLKSTRRCSTCSVNDTEYADEEECPWCRGRRNGEHEADEAEV